MGQLDLQPHPKQNHTHFRKSKKLSQAVQNKFLSGVGKASRLC